MSTSCDPPAELLVVTGAAGGIGRATCAAFLAAGFPVIGVDLSPSVEMPPDGGSDANAHYRGFVADVCDDAAMADVVSRAGRPVHHLVTCAGIALHEESQAGAGRGMPEPEVFRRSVELNLTGHYVALCAVWPSMRDAVGNRSVGFASSINALQGYGLVGYSSAKAGLIGLTHALLAPLGAEGVRVNVVAPGTIPTPSTRKEWAHVPDHFDRMAASVPIGRLGEPEDVAAAFLSLARDLRHVSGQTLIVDGGQSRGR